MVDRRLTPGWRVVPLRPTYEQVQVGKMARNMAQAYTNMVERAPPAPPAHEVPHTDAEAIVADAARYRWLRERDLETINRGGIFAGRTPDNVVVNFDDLDSAIDAAMLAEKEGKNG